MSPRPHLFFSLDDIPAIRAKIQVSPIMAKIAAVMLERANENLDLSLDPYPLVSPQNGMGTAGRAVQNRVGLLAFCGYLTGDPKYFEKAKAILLAVARQTQPGNKKDWATHLQHADAAQGFAIGYDWLYPHMTGAERREIVGCLRQFGELLYTEHVVWSLPDPAVSSCNHNAVQFGALGLCALILEDEPDPKPEWLAFARDRIRAYLKYSMDETGYITEGLGYMGYGLGGALPFCLALQRQTGLDLIAEQPLFQKTSDQVLWKILPNGHVVAMNDSMDDPPSFSTTYAMYRFRQPEHLWMWWQSLGENGFNDYALSPASYLTGSLGAPFLLIWGDPALQPAAPDENHWPLGHQFSSGRVFLRSSWDQATAAHFSLTSGVDFHQGHNHQDENAVTFFALGEYFLIDPQYDCKSTRCHNTMFIGGADQVFNSAGRVVQYREEANDARGAFLHGQAPGAYDWNKALVGYFDRKIYLVRRPSPYLIWRDDAQVETEQIVDFVELFHTDPRNQIELAPNGLRLTGSKTGAKCLIAILNPADGVTTTVTDLSKETFVRNAHTFKYSTFFREGSATTKALNPHFVVLVFPYREESEIPHISLTDEGDTAIGKNLSCRLQFADGREDRFDLADQDIQFTRS